MLLVIFNEGLF